MVDLNDVKAKLNEYKKLSSENAGLRAEFEDMDMLDMNFLGQIVLSDADQKLWLKFNDGKVDVGEGDVESPTLTFSTSLSVFSGIIAGNVEISSAHEAGDVSFNGPGEALMDLQAITSIINEFMQNL